METIYIVMGESYLIEKREPIMAFTKKQDAHDWILTDAKELEEFDCVWIEEVELNPILPF